MNEFFNGCFHTTTLVIKGHYGLVVCTVGEVSSKYFLGYFQSKDVALFPYFDKNLGVLAFSRQVVFYGFQLIEVVA